MSRFLSLFASLILILLVLTPVSAHAADNAVGNEILNVTNSTLTRSGAGTAASPYTVALNLSNSNTWLSPTIFNSTLTVNDVLTVTNSVSVSGDIAVNGGDITSTVTTGAIFNTNVTTLNLGGAATSLTIGANSGTATLRNATVSFPNASAVNAASATASFETVLVGGGYGLSGFTVYSNGTVAANGNLVVDGTSTLTGNVTTSGDLAVNGADITTNGSSASVFNTNATTVNMAGAASTLSMGANFGSTTIRNATIVFPNATSVFADNALLTVGSVNLGGGYGSTGATFSTNGNIQTNGNLTVDGLTTLSGNTVAGGSLTVDGAATFNLSSNQDMTVNTDSDSHLSITGLATSTGSPLCLDASNTVVLCAESGASMSAAMTSTSTGSLEQTVQKQQEEINLLKQEIEALKAKLQ